MRAALGGLRFSRLVRGSARRLPIALFHRPAPAPNRSIHLGPPSPKRVAATDGSLLRLAKRQEQQSSSGQGQPCTEAKSATRSELRPQPAEQRTPRQRRQP